MNMNAGAYCARKINNQNAGAGLLGEYLWRDPCRVITRVMTSHVVPFWGVGVGWLTYLEFPR